MRDIPTALQDHLDTRETTLAYCWKISRKDGVVLGFTSHDKPISFDSVTYSPNTAVNPTGIEKKLDMSTDNLDVIGAIDSSAITEEDIERGLYDSARVDIYQVNWKDVSERYLLQAGVIGNITYGELEYVAEFRGLSYQLQQTKGRIYSPLCDAVLGDSRCGVSLTTYTGNVDSNPSTYSISTGDLSAQDTNFFTRGKITFTSGANDGVEREIRSDIKVDNSRTITFWEPLPFDPSVGDTFDITAGCDKTYETCKAKFSNGSNFRGFPYIPPKETVFRIAKPSSKNDYNGQSLFK